MSAKRSIVGAFLIVVAAFGLPAQQKSSTKELTVEELFLRNVELQILREKAYSDDYESKTSALDDLEKKVAAGVSGEDAVQVEVVLEYLALEGTGHRTRESGRLINYFPDVRRRAVAMLPKVGGNQARNALITVLLTDDEPMVKAEAAYALGSLKTTDTTGIVQALAFAVDREDQSRPDNNWGYAMLLAFEKLSKQAGGLKDPAAYRAILKIAEGSYMRSVKDKAWQILAAMK